MKKALLSIVIFLFAFSLYSQPIIIDHNCAFLDPIPESAINQAHENIHIAYGHTSHGSQITTGIEGLANQTTDLMGYKGDIYCWDYYSSDNPDGEPCLDLDDYFVSGDLGHNGDTEWADKTRNYLDNNSNSSDINVVMWSWCGGCSDNTYEGIETYLNTMNQLELDYPDITFVYMTGHADIWSDETLKANNQHIRDYCVENDKVLFDFEDIEHYDPDGNYFEYVNDDCSYYDSDMNELGNWALEWQDSHVEGVDWYDCYAAHTKPLNGNRKAYAGWWMFSRIAGWEGPTTTEIKENNIETTFHISPNPTSESTTFFYNLDHNSNVKIEVFDYLGILVEKSIFINQNLGEHSSIIDLSSMPSGLYFFVLSIDDDIFTKKIFKTKSN